MYTVYTTSAHDEINTQTGILQFKHSNIIIYLRVKKAFIKHRKVLDEKLSITVVAATI